MERKYQIGDVLRVVAGTAHSGELNGDDEYHYYSTGTIVEVINIRDFDLDGGYMTCAPIPNGPSAWLNGDDQGTQFLRDQDVQLVHRMRFETITDVEDYLNDAYLKHVGGPRQTYDSPTPGTVR